MIEIRQQEIEKYLQDNIPKKVTISFLNNTHTTLTNNDIVLNTLQITESLNSHDELKFGTCDSSSLEVTVNCPENIKGHKIKVEIEVDSKINLGTFVIDSCKRQNGTNLRDIVAYSVNYTNNTSFLEQFTKWKAKLPVYEDDANKIFYSSVEADALSTHSELIDSAHWTSYEEIKYILHNQKLKFKEVMGGIETGKYFEIYFDRIPNLPYPTRVSRYSWTPNDDYKEYMPELEFLMEYGEIEYQNMFDGKSEVPLYSLFRNGFAPFMHYKIENAQTSVAVYEEFFKMPDEAYFTGLKMMNNSEYPVFLVLEMFIPTKLVYHFSGRLHTFYFDYRTLPLFYDTGLPDPATSPYAIRLERKKQTSYEGIPCIYSDSANSINYDSLLSDYYEIQGLFGLTNREGRFEPIAINDYSAFYPENERYPMESLKPSNGKNMHYITKAMYKDAGLEGFKTMAYGGIKVKYMGLDGETYGFSMRLDYGGDNMYVMDNNQILTKNMWTQEQVEQLMIEMFENIKNISYNVGNITMRGLPHMEVGDHMDIETDEGVVHMICLRRTISGENLLVDSVEADGVEITPNSQYYFDVAGYSRKE